MSRKKTTKDSGLTAHQNGGQATDVSKEEGDVEEHEDVADENGEDVCLTLTVQLIFKGSLRGEVRISIAHYLLNVHVHYCTLPVLNWHVCTQLHSLVQSGKSMQCVCLCVHVCVHAHASLC